MATHPINEDRVPVLKSITGRVLAIANSNKELPMGPPMVHMMKTCGAANHKIKWGPYCRVMKRKPKGQEYVSILCKTCGDYVEWILPAS